MSRNCVPKSCKVSEKKPEINESEIRTPNSTLPPGWRWVRVEEVCNRTKNRDPRDKPEKTFQYVDISSIDNRLKRITEARKILGKDAPSRARQVVKFNDVLVATTRPNLNAVALVPKNLDNEICSTGFSVLRPSESVNPLFLFFFVKTRYFLEIISGQVRGMMYPAVTNGQVRNVFLPLASLSEQKRIAAKLQELMQEVERARTACEKQLEAAKALPAAYLREVFESEEAKKWERKRLGEVCEIIMGQSPPGYTYNTEGKGLPFYQGKIEFGRGHLKSPATWCSEPQKIAEPNDILISIRTPVGPTNMCNIKSCIGRGLAALRPTNSIESRFVFYSLRFIEPEICRIGQGSTFSAISKSQIQNLEIPFPPLLVQHHIASELKEKMAEVEKLHTGIEKQLEAINALPQAILKKAFRGKL